MNINVIFEDKNIIVVEKPTKLPCQSDKTNDDNLLDILREKIKVENPKLKNVYLELVHRLDRPVGGALVLVKTKESNSNLSKQIQNRQLKKEYLTIVCGRFEENKGELKDYLKKLSTINMSKVVDPNTHGAKEAILAYQVLETIETEEYGVLSLIKVNLKTGRHHQIRVQLANANCPIWGDNKYNKSFVGNKGWTQIALWSYSLSFRHPIKNNYLTFNSTPTKEYPWDLFDLR
ncbi:ribosomal large subunit pseudouridine synthase C [Gottschalkia acidurici 9a]|uniref:RNA pseudouridylate synthase n=1 Tax=Gottschalkia acidurici (strain ATCC 7906 / DSM 604 / BCRC 14475 / CIP 104303 / KCTC 5404 / NCIMB 10678 / 9a) TaxID=1128398 RepID=K0B3S3_GOTA9|nr:RNA pseudouridine synthase [Gottschalkia acidurici]AFS79540.1 ribosomal large subunit pseudouridine synthase C [Gottschalkia acidurici 9a]